MSRYMRLADGRYLIGGTTYTEEQVIAVYRSGALLQTDASCLVRTPDGLLLVRTENDLAGITFSEVIAHGPKAQWLLREVQIRLLRLRKELEPPPSPMPPPRPNVRREVTDDMDWSTIDEALETLQEWKDAGFDRFDDEEWWESGPHRMYITRPMTDEEWDEQKAQEEAEATKRTQRAKTHAETTEKRERTRLATLLAKYGTPPSLCLVCGEPEEHDKRWSDFAGPNPGPEAMHIGRMRHGHTAYELIVMGASHIDDDDHNRCMVCLGVVPEHQFPLSGEELVCCARIPDKGEDAPRVPQQ